MQLEHTYTSEAMHKPKSGRRAAGFGTIRTNIIQYETKGLFPPMLIRSLTSRLPHEAQAWPCHHAWRQAEADKHQPSPAAYCMGLAATALQKHTALCLARSDEHPIIR